MKRQHYAVAISLDLNVVKAATQQAATRRRQVRQRDPYIEAITSLVSLVVVDWSVGVNRNA
jgi:hypothetical protein